VRHPLVERHSANQYLYYRKKASQYFNPMHSPTKHKFVIFNYPRTGSNLLCGMLNQHPEILCHHELFNPTRIYYSKDFQCLFDNDISYRNDWILGKIGLSTIFARDIAPEKFIHKIWDNSFDAKAVGFNLFPSHIPNTASVIVSDETVKKILLIRRNKLKAYISLMIAKKSSVWDLYKSDFARDPKIPVQQKVHVNIKKFLAWCDKYDNFFEKLKNKCSLQGQEMIEIYYEDMVGEKQEEIKTSLLGFLKVSQTIQYLKPPLKKQNTDSVRELVGNYNELKQKLEGTPFAFFL
jgi:LPS sulfotransferase NodH